MWLFTLIFMAALSSLRSANGRVAPFSRRQHRFESGRGRHSLLHSQFQRVIGHRVTPDVYRRCICAVYAQMGRTYRPASRPPSRTAQTRRSKLIGMNARWVPPSPRGDKSRGIPPLLGPSGNRIPYPEPYPIAARRRDIIERIRTGAAPLWLTERGKTETQNPRRRGALKKLI